MIARVLAIAPLLCLVSGDPPATRPADSTPAAASQPAVMTVEQLAAQVKAAYRSLDHLSLSGHCESPDPPVKVEFVVRMAADSFDADIKPHGGPAVRMALRNGKIRESRSEWECVPRSPSGSPGLTLGDVALEYKAPLDCGTDYLVLRRGIDDKFLCLVGSFWQTWVGPHARFPDFLERRISQGKLMPPAEEAGDCWIVLWEQREPGDWRQDVFYIAKSTKLLARWETRYSGDESAPKLERDRRYTSVSPKKGGAD